MAEESFDVVIPLELEAGVYAEKLGGWFTADGLVLDFAAPSGEDQLLVTSRIRIPATAVLQARADLDDLIRDYELQFGEIRRPRPRGEK